MTTKDKFLTHISFANSSVSYTSGKKYLIIDREPWYETEKLYYFNDNGFRDWCCKTSAVTILHYGKKIDILRETDY